MRSLEERNTEPVESDACRKNDCADENDVLREDHISLSRTGGESCATSRLNHENPLDQQAARPVQIAAPPDAYRPHGLFKSSALGRSECPIGRPSVGNDGRLRASSFPRLCSA